MRKIYLTVIAFASFGAAAPAWANGTLFMCKFGETVGGAKMAETQIYLFAHSGADDSLLLDAADDGGILQGKQFRQIEGDFSAPAGQRKFAFETGSEDGPPLLLTMGSAKKPQFFRDRFEVLVGMFGGDQEKDPRAGQCAMLQGPVEAAYEAFKSKTLGN